MQSPRPHIARQGRILRTAGATLKVASQRHPNGSPRRANKANAIISHRQTWKRCMIDCLSPEQQASVGAAGGDPDNVFGSTATSVLVVSMVVSQMF
jgi:hypothetical protein